MKSNIIKFFLISIIITILLMVIWFWNIHSNQFLFLHDEFLPLSQEEAIRSFFIRDPSNLGASSVINIIVGFFDRVIYLLFYSFDLNLNILQIILYSLKVFLLITIPYLGFKKLAMYFQPKATNMSIFIVSFWYSFNTFTLIYWNLNAFSFTALICYILAPIALYYYHQSIFENNSITAKIKTVILLYLMSFGFYLFAVFVLFLFLYTLVYSFLKKIKTFFLLKNLFLLTIIYLPLITIILVIPYDIYTNKNIPVNFLGNSAYGNLKGGVLNQMLMLYSWSIYSYWEPRNIFTFFSYFKSAQSVIAPFILYYLILAGIIRNKLTESTQVFFFIFLFLLFFIKGAQEPFGNLYLFLINNSLLFNVFRSPDTKLGFGIVLTVSILLISVAPYYRKKLFILIIAFVVLIQNWPIFNGMAVKGQNTIYSSDRIIYISKEYKEILDFLEKNKYPYSYTMPFPTEQFTIYKLNTNEKHLGQDLLSKLASNPFVYLSETKGINMLTYKKLVSLVKTNSFTTASDFPIRYFLMRHDIISKPSNKVIVPKSIINSKPAFNNKLFTIYENPTYTPLIHADDAKFQTINPVYHKVKFTNIKKDAVLKFHQSFSENWKLYTLPMEAMYEKCKRQPLININCYFRKEEVNFFWQNSVFDSSHVLENGYANKWIVSPKYIKDNFDKSYYEINPDGSMDIEIALYYKPQSIFYNGIIISFSYLILLIVVYIFLYKKNK